MTYIAENTIRIFRSIKRKTVIVRTMLRRSDKHRIIKVVRKISLFAEFV